MARYLRGSEYVREQEHAESNKRKIGGMICFQPNVAGKPATASGNTMPSAAAMKGMKSDGGSVYIFVHKGLRLPYSANSPIPSSTAPHSQYLHQPQHPTLILTAGKYPAPLSGFLLRQIAVLSGFCQPNLRIYQADILYNQDFVNPNRDFIAWTAPLSGFL